MKNQAAPWGDVLLLENPGDEVFFGEVYRQVLQEAWLPSGSEVWSRVGKSRRGRRPTQRGLVSHSPSSSQVQVRLAFQACVAAWHSLPWESPADPPCDARWGKKYWLDEKINKGLQCSYYDYFMRMCLICWRDTGCICPSMYFLVPSPVQILNAQPGSQHPISFDGACGPVYQFSGPGGYISGIWYAPSSSFEGYLGFKDSAGGQGCVYATVAVSEIVCDPENPVLITPGQILTLKVIGGAPPYTWTSGVGGTVFDDPISEGPSNDLRALDCIPGDEGLINIKDSAATEVNCPMEAQSGGGSWVYAGLWDAKREGDQCGVPIYPGDKTIVLDVWKYVLPTWGGRCSYGGTVWWNPGAPSKPPCSPRACCDVSCNVHCAVCPPCEKNEFGVCQPCTFAAQSMYDYFQLYHWEC